MSLIGNSWEGNRMTTTLKSDRKAQRPPEKTSAATTEKTTERPVWETIAELGAQIPDEEWAKVPVDSSINSKHYLYGAPKNA